MLDLSIGQKFGKLTIVSDPISRNGRYWQCKCECGGTGIMVSLTSLKARRLNNGGCVKCYRTKHGFGRSTNSTYSKYQAMKQRCLNPKHKSFSEYGGRGIKVCPRWLESFENFLADMGECPVGKSIERKDVNGGYDSENCYWATKKEQASNTRSNVQAIVNGVKYKTLKDAATAFGIPYSTVRVRMSQYGWSVEKALITPVDTKRRRKDLSND